jgi:hypothetical protein
MPGGHVHMGRLLAQTFMGLKSCKMDHVTPTRGRETPKDGTRKEEGCFPRDTLAGLDPRGSFPSTMTLALEGP